jgi:hypothetical protein
MVCRNCGTEIADKALVCYRCGTATSEPTRPGRSVASSSSGRRIGPSVVALVLLVLAALYMGRAAVGEVPQVVAWIVAGLAALAVAWRLLIRRGGS